MKQQTGLALLLAGLALAHSSTALAQTPAAPAKITIDVRAGAQTQSRTLDTTTSFPLYGETAVVNAAQAVESGGLFDITGAYRIMSRLSAGVGFSIFSKGGDGSLIASVPNPNIFNRPQTTTATATDLAHKEVGTHLMAVYTLPLMENMEADLFAGPSFFHLTQDVLSATVPPGTQTANVATTSEKGSATGGNVGVNVSYMFKPNYGVAVFMRYAGATIDLPSAPGAKVGGFQLGGGAHFKF